MHTDSIYKCQLRRGSYRHIIISDADPTSHESFGDGLCFINQTELKQELHASTYSGFQGGGNYAEVSGVEVQILT